MPQVYKHSLYCFGGYNGRHVLNDFWEYKFEPVLIPPPTLKADLRSLLDNQMLSDVTFIVEDRPIRARCVVVTACPSTPRTGGASAAFDIRPRPTGFVPMLCSGAPAAAFTSHFGAKPSGPCFSVACARATSRTTKSCCRCVGCRPTGDAERPSAPLPRPRHAAPVSLAPAPAPALPPPPPPQDISYPVFMKVLEFLYTDDITGLDDDSDIAVSLLIAAER